MILRRPVRIVGTAALGLIGTLTLFDAEQPVTFPTTSVSPTFPEAPAVYVIVWTFVALVMVLIMLLLSFFYVRRMVRLGDVR